MSPTAATSAPTGLTVEAIVAIEPPREFRLHPRLPVVACTDEIAGTRQLCTISIRTGARTQITASSKNVSEPEWSPDGRRLAYVRDEELWIVGVDGSRPTLVVAKRDGATMPRWSPDGRRLGFLSRRRGWSQVWVIDAPIPRRGRPAHDPRPPVAEALTEPGIDVAAYDWSPDGSTLVVEASLPETEPETAQICLLHVADRRLETIAGQRSLDTAARWLPDGGLLSVSDESGWFQVVHRAADGRRRVVLTSGEREHGEPWHIAGFAPTPSPDGRRFVHVEIEAGLSRLVVADLDGAAVPKRGRGRPPKVPRTVTAAAGGRRVDPWDGMWRTVGWMADGAWLVAVGEGQSEPADLWLLPVPGAAPDGSRPRRITDSRPAVVANTLASGRIPAAERIAFTARDGLRIEGTLWRPPSATGKRGGRRVPTIVFPHGGPTAQAWRSFVPFKLLLVEAGFAFLDVDFRGSTGYGRAFRVANHGEWGHADVHDVIDAGRWATEQSWSDGRLVVYGGSYGGYLTLCAIVEEPGMWQAAVDLYGDSEIAESYRHGDRLGRLDLHRMMGSPDDPERQDVYRRGSPVYRAERIEAPLLILHGRKDKRVVPLMTERMVEALEIEGKRHEVHWYDEEGHGWERRENRRDAFERILAFLRTHVLDEDPAPG